MEGRDILSFGGIEPFLIVIYIIEKTKNLKLYTIEEETNKTLRG
jgi:hypothetical protein